MRIRLQHVTLIASLVILLVSGGLAVDFLFQSAMAYYDTEPARTVDMHRFQNYADFCSVVFVIAAVASIVFGVIVFRNWRRTKTRLHEKPVVAD